MTILRRRLRLNAAVAVAFPLAALLAFSWISLRFAVSLRLARQQWLLPSAIAALALVIAAAIVRAFSLRLSDESLVRSLDRAADSRGRVIAAFELASSANPFAQAAVADAGAALADARSRVAALFPLRLPVDASRVAALVLLAPLCALVLRGVEWRSLGAPLAAPHVRPEMARVSPPDEIRSLPALPWLVHEAKTVLAPLARPVPAALPAVALAATPTPRPPRGSTITDPEKRAYFEKVLKGANDDSVAQEIGMAFTHEWASKELQAIEAQVLSKSTAAGKQFDPGGGGGAKPPSMPQDVAKLGGGIKPKVDPAKMKSEYMKDKDQDSALAEVIKASFDDYLKQFSADLLRGMEEALEAKLSGTPAKGTGAASVGLKALPDSPAGMANALETSGPKLGAKSGDGDPAAVGADAQQAIGGTAAGGAGAGAGSGDEAGTKGPDALAEASGSRVDLGGSLDKKLAVVEVVRRMSGGSDTVEDSASAELVQKSTKAAEAAAAKSDDVPPEYRGAVEAYFRALSR